MMNQTIFKRRMMRRGLIRTLSFTTFIIVTLIIALIVSLVTAAQYRMRLEYTYERGLSELAEHLVHIETTLTKGLYTGTASGATKLAMHLQSEADAAKVCLTQIPTQGIQLENTYRFLSQVGEYALSLANSMKQGNTLTEQQHSTMVQLSNYAKEIRSSIDALCNEMNGTGKWKEHIDSNLRSHSDSNSWENDLNHLEESLKDFPTLLYDGPFSEHILQPTPLLLQGLPMIGEADAKVIAAKAMGCTTDQLTSGQLQQNNVFPCYVYTWGSKTAAITHQGGIVSFLYNTRNVTDTKLQYDQCISIAEEYLKSANPGLFKECYYTVAEGVCLINFAYVEHGVICYPDLIKVGVALDTGEIVSYNAQGYIMNHVNRSLPTPQHTVEQAQAILSPYLTVKQTNTAIIPTDSQTPKLCYEFLCIGDQEDEILVYVNTETLEEEELFILLKTDGGTLTL